MQNQKRTTVGPSRKTILFPPKKENSKYWFNSWGCREVIRVFYLLAGRRPNQKRSLCKVFFHGDSNSVNLVSMHNETCALKANIFRGVESFISANQFQYPRTWYVISEKLYFTFMVWRNYSHWIEFGEFSSQFYGEYFWLNRMQLFI